VSLAPLSGMAGHIHTNVLTLINFQRILAKATDNMNIRWRLAILAIQLVVLALVSHLVTGQIYAKETWYFAGLLAIVINPQLLEPFYSRPVDIIANSIIFFVLAATDIKTITAPGWYFAGGCFGIAMLLSIIALVFGAGKRFGKYTGLASGARILSQFVGCRVIYSVVFLLSVVEYKPTFDTNFWRLVFGWAAILVLGIINWQAVWSTTRGREEVCAVEGMIGPSSLLPCECARSSSTRFQCFPERSCLGYVWSCDQPHSKGR